ncbi:GntR family transcriptional regulator [Serratia sp. M24T3]|uniref:GntR family transcriptional regulator n=1 Tax=Serratia sp. M24T3 TaxID=932213 RepID=UPI00025B919B|nr:GntR family transcriptional regulator [Serratia sp. M24T3]EIC83486.1 GntR family transcriptional regulator [Serratia sp. M24T3]
MKTDVTQTQERPVYKAAGLSLNEQAYRGFKLALVTLSYKPGEYLNTAQVMNDLSMGRTPINQAIHRLANEGLLQIIPRKGVMVSPLSIDDALELIEVRLANEILCMKLASQRISPQDIVELEAINQQIESASELRDRNQLMLLDNQFHQLLAKITGNKMLIDILSVLHAQAQRFWASSLSKEGHMQEVIEEHRAIISALAAQDARSAAAAAEVHILSFRNALLRG